MSEAPEARPRVLRHGTTALLVGVVALALTGVGGLLNQLGYYPHADPGAAFRSYLFAWLFWAGVSAGAMAMLMLYHCTGGGWGLLVARLAEHAAMVLPLMAVLFIPVCLGTKHLYPWGDPQNVQRDPVLTLRHPYLNPTWFAIRSAIYLVALVSLASCLRSWSLADDSRDEPRNAGRLGRLSAGGLLAYFLVITLASIDWIMSREAHWYSSVYGFITVIGQCLSGLCFLLALLALLRNTPPFDTLIRPSLLNDLGNLLLTLVILWAYLALSQFLVIWMGNVQTDITWYLHRTYGGWRYAAAVLVLAHFAVPFALLLKQSNKRDVRTLGAIAGGVLVLRVLDMMWMVLPSSDGPTPHGVSWMDFTAFIGIGGLWFAAFCWLQRGRPLVAQGGREVIGSFPHGEHRTTSPVA